MKQLRHIILTERMHGVLMSVLVDAVAEDREDEDVRKLANICKAARIERREGQRITVTPKESA